MEAPRRTAPAAAALLLAAVHAAAGARPDAGRPDIVLAVCDALRADAVGAWGDAGMRTPHLDGLARRGVQLSEVRAASPWTLPSLASAFSGLPPHATGALGHMDTVSRDVRLLPERLRSAGYRTLAVSANYVYAAPAAGLGRGFERFDVLTVDREGALHVGEGKTMAWLVVGGHRPAPAAAVVGHALRLAHRFPSPRFVYLHLMDTHWPYHLARPEGRGGYAGDDIRDVPAARRTAYLTSLPELDRRLGHLAARLDLARTRLVVTSDHGEELGDHGAVDHGHSLHEELLRVPAVVAGARVVPALDAQPRSLVDLAAAASTGSWPAARLVGAERDNGAVERALHVGGLKLSLRADGSLELRDLAVDPGERAPGRALLRPAWAMARAALAFWELRPGRPSREAAPIPEEVLRSLGYVR